MTSAASVVARRKYDIIVVEALYCTVETILHSRVQDCGASDSVMSAVGATAEKHRFNFKLPKIPNIRRDMVWWREDVERPLTLELRWLSEPEVDVFVEQWSVCFTAAACPPAPDVAAKIHRDTYARITIFLRSLFTTLRALPAHQLYTAGLTSASASATTTTAAPTPTFRPHFYYRLLISDPRRPSLYASSFSDSTPTRVFRFPPIVSSFGALDVCVRYRSDDHKKFLPSAPAATSLEMRMIETYMDEFASAPKRARFSNSTGASASAGAGAGSEDVATRAASSSSSSPSPSPSLATSMTDTSVVVAAAAATDTAAATMATAITATLETFGVSVSPLYPDDSEFLRQHGIINYHVDALNLGVFLLVFPSYDSAATVRSAFLSQGRQVGFVVSGASIASSVHYSPPCSVGTQFSPPSSMFASPAPSPSPMTSPMMRMPSPSPFSLPPPLALAMAPAQTSASAPSSASITLSSGVEQRAPRHHRQLTPLRRTVGFDPTARTRDSSAADAKRDDLAQLLSIIEECRLTAPPQVFVADGVNNGVDAAVGDVDTDVSL